MTTAGQLLQSGGEVYITASMTTTSQYINVNGVPTNTTETVLVNKYGLGFPQATASNTTMQLFYGNTNNADSVVTWDAADTSTPGKVAHGADSFQCRPPYTAWYGFLLDSTSNLGAINCDRFFHNDSTLTSVKVILPDSTFNTSNTQMFLVLPTLSSIMASCVNLYTYSNYDFSSHTLTMVSEGKTNIVPSGLPYKLIVLSKKGTQMYFYTTTGTIPTTGINTIATIQPMSQSAIAAQLLEL
jgi:hypothetical protein